MIKLHLPHDARPDARYIVAVSGGPDSVCLLRAMTARGLNCVAAHCNFRLRGEASDGDEQFVRALTAELGVELEVTAFDTVAYARRHHVSIEMAARELRYEWFERMRVLHGCDYIAVAHNLNDRVETFFLNLTRGTGLTGLTGMEHEREHIVRPLLDVSRAEIMAYLEAEGAGYCIDESNADIRYRRNRIRHRVLPELEAMNPSFLNTMARTMENLSAAQAMLEGRGGAEQRLEQLHLQLSPLGFNRSQITAIVRAELAGRSGACFHAGGSTVVVDRGRAVLHSTVTADSRQWAIDEEQISTDADMRSSELSACFDADLLARPLALRAWQAGDRFHPYGMRGSKLVSDLLTERRLDVVAKSRVQVLTDSRGRIVWVVGHRTDARFAVTGDTRRAVRLTVRAVE